MIANLSRPNGAWQMLHELLRELLATHGVLDAFGDGDFFLVDDDWGAKQHKIECRSEAAATPQLLAEIQSLLGPHPDGWEVIVATPSRDGIDHAFVVTRDGCVEHDA